MRLLPAHVCVCVLQGVLSLLNQVEKKAEESGEKDTDKKTTVAEALEAVNGIRSIAPLVPDLVSTPSIYICIFCWVACFLPSMHFLS